MISVLSQGLTAAQAIVPPVLIPYIGNAVKLAVPFVVAYGVSKIVDAVARNIFPNIFADGTEALKELQVGSAMVGFFASVCVIPYLSLVPVITMGPLGITAVLVSSIGISILVGQLENIGTARVLRSTVYYIAFGILTSLCGPVFQIQAFVIEGIWGAVRGPAGLCQRIEDAWAAKQAEWAAAAAEAAAAEATAAAEAAAAEAAANPQNGGEGEGGIAVNPVDEEPQPVELGAGGDVQDQPAAPPAEDLAA